MAAEIIKGAKMRYPVAKPADPLLQVSASEPDETVEIPFFTLEKLKGWGSSLALHVLLLLVMAFWYFAPPYHPPRVFDTRLAGSEMGVENGLTATGGLSAELAMPEGSAYAAEVASSGFQPLELKALDPNNAPGAKNPTGGGGMDSNNPGAGDGDGFGLARFGQGGESVRGVAVKVGDPQFTLLWDSDVDLDLHVVEPGGKNEPGGKEIYWVEPKGRPGLGGELDVDNTKGYGPENIYWLRQDEAKAIPGPGPPGTYKWFVVYYGGFGGKPKLTHWKVRIKHDGKVTIVTGKLRRPDEQSKVYSLRVEPSP